MNGGTRFVFASGALLAVCACAGTPPPSTVAQPAAPMRESVAWSVGPCFGFCPVYKVVVDPTPPAKRSARQSHGSLAIGGIEAIRSCARRPPTGPRRSSSAKVPRHPCNLAKVDASSRLGMPQRSQPWAFR